MASIAPDAGRQVPDALVPEPTQPERPEFGPPVSEPAPDRKRLLAPPDNAGPPDWEALVDDALPAAEESLVVGITSGALPDEDRKVVEAGLADLVGNVDLADLPAGFAAGTLDGPRGIAPLEDPAVAEALAHELSISDLLAEDLAIPETAVDRDELSLSELLAEDLTIPDAGGAGEAQPSVVKPELPTPDDHPVSEQPSTGSTSGRNGPRGRDDTSLDSAPAADPDPGADAAPAPDTDTDTGDGDGPDTTPSKPTYRQLPEARPGIMRGLRAGWNRPRE